MPELNPQPRPCENFNTRKHTASCTLLNSHSLPYRQTATACMEQSNLPVAHMLMNSSAFYGNRSFTTVFTSLPLVPMLSQINPVHVLITRVFKTILPSIPRSSKRPFLQVCTPTPFLVSCAYTLHALPISSSLI
jgi:hypothetical protein